MTFLVKFAMRNPRNPIVETPTIRAKYLDTYRTKKINAIGDIRFREVEVSGSNKAKVELRIDVREAVRADGRKGTMSWMRSLYAGASRREIVECVRVLSEEDAELLRKQDELIEATLAAVKALRETREELVAAAFRRGAPGPWQELLDEAEQKTRVA